jgi:adenine-specific DNA glycosylase
VVRGVAVVASLHEQVLLERRGPQSFLAGHALFPLILGDESAEWNTVFTKRFPAWQLDSPVCLATVRHAIMSTRYEIEIWQAALNPTSKTPPPQNADSVVWVADHLVGQNLTNALAKKIWDVVQSGRAKRTVR